MPRPYDPESSVDVKEWIERVLEEQLPPGDVIDSLKDGVVLCRLVNALQPNSASFKKSSMPFVQMENIAAFLRACDKVFNVPHHELFETVDLYDGNDPVQVITTLRSLSRHAHEMNSSVPVLGPRLNTQKYERHFTKKADIPAWNTRQYGQIGISQGTEGVVMGGRRDIVGVQSKPSPKAPNIIVPNDPNRKPSKPPKPVNLKPSVFGEDNEEEEEQQQRPAFGRGFYGKNDDANALKTELMGNPSAPVDESSAQDPSIYAYDEVYDSMQAARDAVKGKKKDAQQAQYVDRMLKAKEIRERDRLRAREIKLKRERENEGDEFADKEMFVTSAYKKQQEELQKLQVQEEKEQSGEKNLAKFSRNLNKSDEDVHEAMMRAAVTTDYNDSAFYDDAEQNDNDDEKDADDDGLNAGLNVVSKKSQLAPSRAGTQRKESKQPRMQPYNRGRSTEEFMRSVEKQHEEHRRKEAKLQQDQKQSLVNTLKSSHVDNDAVAMARQRYLERKKRREE